MNYEDIQLCSYPNKYPKNTKNDDNGNNPVIYKVRKILKNIDELRNDLIKQIPANYR